MGWNPWKSIQDIAKKVVSSVSNVMSNPVVASIASFIPGGSAIVGTVSTISKSMEKMIPEEVVVQKQAIALVSPPVAVAIGSTGGAGWKVKYVQDTKGLE